MKSLLPRTIIKGLVGGILVGFVIGFYVLGLTSYYVIQAADFVHEVSREHADSRYATVILVSFMVVFAAIGPFFATGTYGPWLRHAIYGLVGAITLVTVIGLIGAGMTNEQPFYVNKLSNRKWIDGARFYGITVAVFIGPVAGILIGQKISRRSEP
ncbi:MAG: hypothetical protein O2955_01990 [Planctomycetota bacterium]|nr:hypothetical protein [Planctomycetota bacterium]MDA1211253.1 hypothetical protein [Planctomycetota bacterium]